MRGMYRESNPTIELFVDGEYKATTKWSRNRKEAIEIYSNKKGICQSRIKAYVTK